MSLLGAMVIGHWVDGLLHPSVDPRKNATRLRVAFLCATKIRSKARLHADYRAELLDGGCALFKGSILFGGELDFDDLLETRGAQLAGNADIEALNAVFALKISSARQDLLLVLQNRFHHFNRGRRGSIVGAARLEVFHD